MSCWLGGALSASANWMLALAVPFLVYEMTESTTWLGIAAVASNGPSLIASPLGGVWSDRYSKRAVLLSTLVAQVSIATLLFLSSSSGSLSVGRLIGLAAVMGFASAAHLSAYQAFVAEIVPPHQIGPAYRLNAIQFNLSRAIGPAIAGYVLARGGPTTTFAVNALGYLPLAGVLLFVRPLRRVRERSGSVVGQLAEGARIAWQDPRLGLALVVASFGAAFGMSIHPLIAGLAKDVFTVGEQGLGMLVSSIGLASVLGSLWIVWVGDGLPRSAMVRWGLLLYGAGLFVVAATNVFAIGLLGFAITGLAHVLVNVSVTTSIQVHVPEAFRGRVTSLQLMGIIVSMPIGAQLGGLLGEWIGLSAVVALYATALVGFATWGWRRADRLRALD